MNSVITQAISQTRSTIEPEALAAFMNVESGGQAFDKKTGKLLIQFEPKWFKRKAPYAPSGKWSVNGVERQAAEWVAFNDAFKRNPDAAMQSTSIGLPQIMGFHWERLGYSSVGAMWDDFKTGDLAQIKALIRFIETDEKLLRALVTKDWHTVASIYNGAGYLDQAKKLGIVPYNIQMTWAYARYKST